MTLNFQNKIVFPAPEASYTTQTAYGQVIYIPRDYLTKEPNATKLQQPKIKKQEEEPRRRSFKNFDQVEFNIRDRIYSSEIKGDQSDQVNQPQNQVNEEQDKRVEKTDEVKEEVQSDQKEQEEDKGGDHDFQIDDDQSDKHNLPSNLNLDYIVETDKSKNSQILIDSMNKSSSLSSLSTQSSKLMSSSGQPGSLLEYIPCLYMPYDDGAEKLVIYFHGNAEDIGLAFDLLYQFGNEMKMHILAVEYPGYGLYKTSKPNENQMKEDADIVFDYLTQAIGIREQDIILFGRSMGSGPATYLASCRHTYALLLMSPYTSIKDAAKSLLGWMSFLSVIVYERFRNIDLIKDAKCPVFFLHGQQDKLIPKSHSEELLVNCPTETFIHSPPFMDHNEFDFQEDLIRPFQKFLRNISGPQRKQRRKTKENEEEESEEKEESKEEVDVTSYYSQIDESSVDYIVKGTMFDLYFDPQLYEAPPLVVEFEKKQEEIANLKSKGKNIPK